MFESRINSLSKDVSSLRAGEISFRESFIRTHGAHLPPIFFHMIPSLKDKPPYFDPRLTEAQWLPDVDLSPIDALVSNNPTVDGGTAIVFPSPGSDTDSVENASLNSPVAVIGTISAVAPTSPVSPFNSLSATNMLASQSTSEKQSIPNIEEPSSASTALKYQELEIQNTQLLKRIADLTAIVEKHGLNSAEIETALSPARVGASTPLFSIGTKSTSSSSSSAGSAVRASIPHVSPEKEASLPTKFDTNSEVERSDRVAADTLTVMFRLRTIQGFLDSAAIKSLLDTISITPSSDNDPDTAWSALGMSLTPSRSSGSSGSSGGGGGDRDRSDVVTGTGAGAGSDVGAKASEAGAVENSVDIESLNKEVRSDPVETLSLLERVTRALLGRIESQKALLERPQMTISYREFHVGSLALFMPLSPKMDVYLAFNRYGFSTVFLWLPLSTD